MTLETFIIEKFAILKAKLNAVNLPIVTRKASEKMQDSAYIQGWNDANAGFLYGMEIRNPKDIDLKHDPNARQIKSDTAGFYYNNEISPLENIRKFRQEVVGGDSFLSSDETIVFTGRNGQTLICSIALANILLQEYNKQYLSEWNPELFIFRVAE